MTENCFTIGYFNFEGFQFKYGIGKIKDILEFLSYYYGHQSETLQ